MIAEESAKWVDAFDRCASKRDLDALLRRIGEFQGIPVQPDRERYADIGGKLGFDGHAELGHRFRIAVQRVTRRPQHA